MGLMLQKMTRGRDLVLWIWTIPLGVSDLAAGLVWLAIMQNTGYLNSALFALGLINGPTAWLNCETPLTSSSPSLLAEIWRATAIVLVILVSGLQLIPKEFSEAAAIFGASPWQRFRRITLPLLKPIAAVRADPAHRAGLRGLRRGLRAGRHATSRSCRRSLVWQNENQNYGVAAAYAVLVMAISLAATLVYLRVLRVAGGAGMSGAMPCRAAPSTSRACGRSASGCCCRST